VPLVVVHLETGPLADRLGVFGDIFPRVAHNTDPIFQPEQAAICSRRGKIPDFSSRSGRLFPLANFYIISTYLRHIQANDDLKFFRGTGSHHQD
jgi:hypothetical protein